jgi:hypothetical protein
MCVARLAGERGDRARREEQRHESRDDTSAMVLRLATSFCRPSTFHDLQYLPLFSFPHLTLHASTLHHSPVAHGGCAVTVGEELVS